jgi:hypothetical protein
LNFGMSILRLSVEKTQAPLKSHNNNRYFLCRSRYICCNISLNSFQNENFFGQKCRVNQNVHFVFNNFSPKILPFMR